MNYSRIYNQIIINRQNNPVEGYTENHHIIPRCLGGSNKKSNIVALTAKEHFICHMLLVKMYPKGSIEHKKMLHAAIGMKRVNKGQQRYINSRLYESLRREYSAYRSKDMTGEGNITFGKFWITDGESDRLVSSDYEIEDGWIKGRSINKRGSECYTCKNKFRPKKLENFCSKACKSKHNRPSFIGREKEFISLYTSGMSMNRALKMMGYPGAMSYYYKWAKQCLTDFNVSCQ